MRVLLGLCVVLLLGGCNRVHTDHPLFFASEAPDAPKLRDGLWVVGDMFGVGEDDDECLFDERKPITRWPKCADWLLVRDGELLGYSGEVKKGGEWQSMPFVLAGSPSVLQVAVTPEEGPTDFQYFGMEVSRRNPEGRIEAYHTWPVLCGPPPPEDAKVDGKPRRVSLTPFPGMTIVEDNCTTDSPDVVLAAAAASREWSRSGEAAHWVRDTYP